MIRPTVKVLYCPGINCHHETVDAFHLAGGNPVLSNLTSDLLSGKERLSDCDILAIPGGFSFGDHVAAGRIVAIDLIYRLKDQLQDVIEKSIPIIGICNGFQVLINTGLLPGGEETRQAPILDRNLSAVFESRWIDAHIQNTSCLWTDTLEGQILRLPVAHGEGRLLIPEPFDDAQTVLRYGDRTGTQKYPDNPNGSPEGRAGITDPSGRILGLMPHPERAIYPWLGSDDGLKIFRSGIEAVR